MGRTRRTDACWTPKPNVPPTFVKKSQLSWRQWSRLKTGFQLITLQRWRCLWGALPDASSPCCWVGQIVPLFICSHIVSDYLQRGRKTGGGGGGGGRFVFIWTYMVCDNLEGKEEWADKIVCSGGYISRRACPGVYVPATHSCTPELIRLFMSKARGGKWRLRIVTYPGRAGWQRD